MNKYNIIVKNPYQFYALPSLVFGLIFQFLFFLLMILQVEGNYFFFAFSLIFLFLGVFLILLGQRRITQIKNIINGKDLIAEWEIPENLWQMYLEKEYIFNKKDATATMFGFIIAGTILAYFGFEVFNLFMFLTGIFLGIPIYFILKMHNIKIQKISKTSNRKVFIAYTGVYIGETFHFWDLYGSGLVDINIIENYFGDYSTLCFLYAIEGRRGPIQKICYVPIPFEKLSIANEIVEKYKKEISNP